MSIYYKCQVYCYIIFSKNNTHYFFIFSGISHTIHRFRQDILFYKSGHIIKTLFPISNLS